MLKIQALYSFLSRLSKREKLIFYGAATFVSLAMIDQLIVTPIYSKITSLNKEVVDKEAGIKKNLRILSQKDRIVEERNRYASLLNKFESGEEDITALLKEVEVLAGKNSVYLIDIKPVGLESEEGQEKYLVRLNCEAEMTGIFSFIYSVESSDKLLTVEDYKITPKSPGSSVARCTMSISKRVMQ